MEEEEIVETIRKIGAEILNVNMDLISDEQLKEIIQIVKKEEENEKE
jgi:biotin synthase-related radical SAM superfamily protein